MIIIKNKLVEALIISFQKRMGYRKEEAQKLGIYGEERKAEVIRNGKRVRILPKDTIGYKPIFEISDVDSMEKTLEAYLEAIRTTDIKSTKMDDRHTDKYFIFNVWKNATASDYVFSEKFIKRYTDFIQDTTFFQYDELTNLGKYGDSLLMVKREQDDYGFETPYIMHFSLTDGRHIYNLPWIRYGIASNQRGEKIAYIYALQKMEESTNKEYNANIKKMINGINRGVKEFRNVTPSAIATLTIFLGMLESEGITAVKAPDFLIGRYGNFAGVTTQEETDRIQTNLTNKFLRNFLRLSEQLSNLKIENTGFIGEYNSFLCMSLDKSNGNVSKNPLLNNLYNLGLSREKHKKKDNSDYMLE